VLRRRRAGRREHLVALSLADAPPVGVWKCRAGRACLHVPAVGGCGQGAALPKATRRGDAAEAVFCRTAHLSPQQLNEFIDT